MCYIIPKAFPARPLPDNPKYPPKVCIPLFEKLPLGSRPREPQENAQGPCLSPPFLFHVPWEYL